eukprot:GEMP01059710.1.p1 GENE.GEMP01059710.1~~GEMP01059710.1.p1  ORF type:complete len:416 (+),score=85.86 GEMP01059710.1:106-1353(+)
MGSFLSLDEGLPPCLQNDLDATMVDAGQCARQMLESKNHFMNPYALGVHKAITKAHRDYVRVLAWDCLNFFPGKVLSGGGDGRICIWDEDSFAQLGSMDMSTSVRSLCVTPGCWLSGHSDGLVVAWDTKTLREITRLDVHREAVYALLYLPQLNCVVSGAEQLVIWEKHIHTFTEIDCIDQEVLCIASAGNCFFTGQMDSDIGVWAIPAERKYWNKDAGHILRGHTRSVWSLACIESRGLLASGSADSTMRIWKLEEWQCAKVLNFDAWVVDLSFGASKLVSASNDGTVKVWNVDLWDVEKTFQLDGEVYCCLVFSDGRIASGGAARSLIVCREAGRAVQESELDKTFRPSPGAADMDSTFRPPISGIFNNSNNPHTNFGAEKEPTRDDWVNPFEFSLTEFQVVKAGELPQVPPE